MVGNLPRKQRWLIIPVISVMMRPHYCTVKEYIVFCFIVNYDRNAPKAHVTWHLFWQLEKVRTRSNVSRDNLCVLCKGIRQQSPMVNPHTEHWFFLFFGGISFRATCSHIRFHTSKFSVLTPFISSKERSPFWVSASWQSRQWFSRNGFTSWFLAWPSQILSTFLGSNAPLEGRAANYCTTCFSAKVRLSHNIEWVPPISHRIWAQGAAPCPNLMRNWRHPF